MKVGLHAIGLYTPSLPSWQHCQDVIAGNATLQTPTEPERYQPTTLPRNERRRATTIIRLVFRLLEQLQRDYSIDMANTASVFASSGGDYDVIDKICSALRREEKVISPTDFHNSVHNAAAGYWSIASHAHTPSTSISAGDQTLPMALLEAALVCSVEQRDTVLVAYDIAPPEPLRSKRPIADPFAAALFFRPEAANAEAVTLDINLVGEIEADSAAHPSLTNVAQSNPIARCLALLSAVALGSGATRFAGNPGVTVDVART